MRQAEVSLGPQIVTSRELSLALAIGFGHTAPTCRVQAAEEHAPSAQAAPPADVTLLVKVSRTMEDPQTLALKAAMRRDAARRRQMAHAAAPDAGFALAKNLRERVPVPAGCAVSGYWPMGEEMDIKPVLWALHEAGHRIGLPVVVGRGKPLIFREWTPGMALIKASFNVEVPPPDALEIVPDLLLVPLLAFDAFGYRLGYGGGFYDRTLRQLRDAAARNRLPLLAVGVAYSAQEVPRVPRGFYDQPLDWIVTEAWARRVDTTSQQRESSP